MIREAVDDYRRYCRDKEMNSTKYSKLTHQGHTKVRHVQQTGTASSPTRDTPRYGTFSRQVQQAHPPGTHQGTPRDAGTGTDTDITLVRA